MTDQAARTAQAVAAIAIAVILVWAKIDGWG